MRLRILLSAALIALFISSVSNAEAPSWTGPLLAGQTATRLAGNLWLLVGGQSGASTAAGVIIYDGATGARGFLHVTFPLLANLYLVLTLLATIFLLGDFNSVYFVTGGGPANSTHLLATLGVVRDMLELGKPQLGVAAVMSALPLLIPLVIILMRKLRTAEVQL